MRLVVQRVSRACVRVGAETVGAIESGFLVLAGVEAGDEDGITPRVARKLVEIRLFESEAGKLDRSLQDVGGAILLVSQFTLLAEVRKGRRPSFERAAAAADASRILERLRRDLEQLGVRVETGRFGARMDVELVNRGPVTVVLDFPPERIAGDCRRSP